MLTLIIRAIGQLPVGRKLLLIYLLDLTAVIYVSSILISEKYISIDFSRKEVAGNAYIAAVRDVLVALPTPLPPVKAGDPGADAASARRASRGRVTARPGHEVRRCQYRLRRCVADGDEPARLRRRTTGGLDGCRP